MKNGIKDTCGLCELTGYSQYLCKMHLKRMAHLKRTKKDPGKFSSAKQVGTRAAVGAGVGIAAGAGGMVLIPAAVLKTLLGHAAVVKMGAGAAGAGAGINIFRKARGKKTPPGKTHKKRRFVYFPSTIKEDEEPGSN